MRLLSAGIDRGFRLFSTIQDQQSRELSQKNIASRAKKLKATQEELKLARVTQLAACEASLPIIFLSVKASFGLPVYWKYQGTV